MHQHRRARRRALTSTERRELLMLLREQHRAEVDADLLRLTVVRSMGGDRR